jgi:uncharacterized RDD family membrane protein YckC
VSDERRQKCVAAILIDDVEERGSMERPAPELGTQGDVFGSRVVAVVVDLILLGVVGGIVTAPVNAVPRVGPALSTALGAVLAFAYFTYLEGTYGQTFGKKLLNVVVVKEDGSACDYEAAVVRNVLRYVDWLPAFYLLGGVVVVLSDDSQRLGDVVGDTLVVRARSARAPDAA